MMLTGSFNIQIKNSDMKKWHLIPSTKFNMNFFTILFVDWFIVLCTQVYISMWRIRKEWIHDKKKIWNGFGTLELNKFCMGFPSQIGRPQS